MPWSHSTPRLRSSQTLVDTGVLEYMGGGSVISRSDVCLAIKNSNPSSSIAPRVTALRRGQKRRPKRCMALLQWFLPARLLSAKQQIVHNTFVFLQAVDFSVKSYHKAYILSMPYLALLPDTCKKGGCSQGYARRCSGRSAPLRPSCFLAIAPPPRNRGRTPIATTTPRLRLATARKTDARCMWRIIARKNKTFRATNKEREILVSF